MAKKQKKSKALVKSQDKSNEDTKQQEQLENSAQATDVPQTTTTTTDAKKRVSGSSRGVCAMHKVVKKKAQGKKFKVRYNNMGVPVGDTRHTLQSYIGMCARTLVPIHIESWQKVDPELKAKIWSDIKDTFKVAPESEGLILKSAGAKWRQFKSNLGSTYVKPFAGQKKKLLKPPRKYAYVGKDSWRKFVEMRTTAEWESLSQQQSGRVNQRKYPHRTSRKGYVGLQEDEVKAGRLDPEEDLDRAILWKIARKPDNDEEPIDPELAEKFRKIDELLEKKKNGEFKSSGCDDVLTAALETPEHSGRVRGVGSFISPSTYFSLPKGKRSRVTKAELLARDRERDEELEKAQQKFERAEKNMLSQIEELKAMISSSNIHSPMFSDKASCPDEVEEKEQVFKNVKLKNKPVIAKELLLVDKEDKDDADAKEDECVAVDPPGKKEAEKCELAVDTIENKVAFGMLFSDRDMSNCVHGVPLQPGFVRVSVDGIIKEDARVPVPIAGEVETVRQAVGSVLAWPEDMVIRTSHVEKKKRVLKSKESDNEYQRLHSRMKNITPSKNVPRRFMLLYKHAVTILKESADSLQIPCDAEVFGNFKTIFLLHENVMALLEFEMVGQAIISTYMAYLYREILQANQTDLYAFFDPGATYKLNDDFEALIVERLKQGPSRLFLMPYNHNRHWILIVIWESEIFILNPLSQPRNFPELEAALIRAVRTFDAQTGRVNKNGKVKNLVGSPKQPGGTECGYVVMRYLKDIFQDKDMKFITRWATKSRKTYTREELDEVRFETLEYIQEFV